MGERSRELEKGEERRKWIYLFGQTWAKSQNVIKPTKPIATYFVPFLLISKFFRIFPIFVNPLSIPHPPTYAKHSIAVQWTRFFLIIIWIFIFKKNIRIFLLSSQRIGWSRGKAGQSAEAGGGQPQVPGELPHCQSLTFLPSDSFKLNLYIFRKAWKPGRSCPNCMPALRSWRGRTRGWRTCCGSSEIPTAGRRPTGSSSRMEKAGKTWVAIECDRQFCVINLLYF